MYSKELLQPARITVKMEAVNNPVLCPWHTWLLPCSQGFPHGPCEAQVSYWHRQCCTRGGHPAGTSGSHPASSPASAPRWPGCEGCTVHNRFQPLRDRKPGLMHQIQEQYCFSYTFVYHCKLLFSPQSTTVLSAVVIVLVHCVCTFLCKSNLWNHSVEETSMARI